MYVALQFRFLRHNAVMASKNKSSIDRVDLAILTELQADARISISELARRVGRSAPAVAERVRKLEEAGIIEGYRAQINPAALGYSVIALIELTTTPAHYDEVHRYAARTPEVQECHFVTGGPRSSCGWPAARSTTCGGSSRK